MSAAIDPRPLIAHVVYRFDIGGLENGVVNLINHLPVEAYRHVVIALTEVTDFRQRITRPDVECIALDKPPGQTFKLYPRLYRLFRKLRPAIVHTRNLAALECTVPAWAAGVPVRIHGEHGREGSDLDGRSRKYRWIRRAYRPFVSRYIALSQELAGYLRDSVGVEAQRLERIYNGVDAEKFHPASQRQPMPGCPFVDPREWLIGTVGRMQPVKDTLLLARAFVRALELAPQLKDSLRLVLVGDGPLRAEVERVLAAGAAADCTWLAGERNDVAQLLRGLDCFVLPSQSEGISNVILEAMATGLPVIATAVGGNGELVEHGHNGLLTPAQDVDAMAQCLLELAQAPERARALGQAGRARVEARYSLAAMVGRYRAVYDAALGRHGRVEY